MDRLFGRLLVSVALLAVTVSNAPPAGAVSGFGDVDADRFFTEAVQWMVDNDITTGTSPTCFSPDDPVTRGQAAAFMWRMEGFPNPGPAHPFSDVLRDWQQSPVSWMFNNQITTGTTPSTYSPDDFLTRGQLAALLHRLAGSPPAPAPAQFTDVVKPWQITPVGWMLVNDITTGTSPNTFSPDDTVTRGQLATFFHRYKGSPAVRMDYSHPTVPRCPGQIDPLPVAKSIALMSCSEFGSILNFDPSFCRSEVATLTDGDYLDFINGFALLGAPNPPMCTAQLLVTYVLVLAVVGDSDAADREFETRYPECLGSPATARWTCDYRSIAATCEGDINRDATVETWTCFFLTVFGEESDPADRRAACLGDIAGDSAVESWQCDWSGLVALPPGLDGTVGLPVLCGGDVISDAAEEQWVCDFRGDGIDQCWDEDAGSALFSRFTCQHHGFYTECSVGTSPPSGFGQNLFSCYLSDADPVAVDPDPWLTVDCVGSFDSVWAFMPVPFLVPI